MVLSSCAQRDVSRPSNGDMHRDVHVPREANLLSVRETMQNRVGTRMEMARVRSILYLCGHPCI